MIDYRLIRMLFALAGEMRQLELRSAQIQIIGYEYQGVGHGELFACHILLPCLEESRREEVPPYSMRAIHTQTTLS